MKKAVVISHGYTLRNPSDSATVGQRIALHHLTGKDTRNLKISKLEASNLIHSLGEAKKNKTARRSGMTISLAELKKLGIKVTR